ncbi:MAG: zinc-ribbon domain-containing protein [Ruminococcaceae bacterium]|nr:zinc-ribbon domain-containing protein [Oscillospiraceae bacterium]
MKQCDNGHFYDDNRFESCPYCREGTGQSKHAAVSFQSQPTPSFQQNANQVPMQQFKFCTRCGNKVEASSKFCTACGNPLAVTPAAPTSDIGKTVAVSPVAPSYSSSDIGKTVAVSSAYAAPTSDIGKTVAVNPAFSANPTTEDMERTFSVRKPAAPASSPTSDIGKTVAVKPMDIPFASNAPSSASASPTSDIGKTVAVKPIDIPFASVAPASSPAPVQTPVQAPTSDIGKTVGGASVQPAPAVAPAIAPAPVQAPVQETPATMSGKTGPAAFLVCIAGANRGDHFVVSGGRNSIASGSEADIRLDKDPSVSADCHAEVDYDPVDNRFTLTAGNGYGITYLNGNQVVVSSDIKAGDRIKLGTSEMLFVPVCSDNFKWDALG